MAPNNSRHVVHSHSRWNRAKRSLAAEKAALTRWGDVGEIDYDNDAPHVARRPITLHRLAFERDEVVSVCPFCNTTI